MAQNARVVGEQKRDLETKMNLSLVGDNLFVHTLSVLNIPFDTKTKMIQ